MIPPLYKWYPMVAAPEYPTKKDALERDRQIELEKKTAKAKEEEVRLKEASAKKAEEEKEKDDHEILETAADTEKKAMKAWKHDNPEGSLKLQKKLHPERGRLLPSLVL